MRNAGEDVRIQEIIEAYWRRIIIELGKYKEDIPLIREDMKKDIFFLSDDECDNEYYMEGQSGKCDFETGCIYIRETSFFDAKDYPPKQQEREIVHEYIHRLARNYVDDDWMSGIQALDKLFYLNEALTEYFTNIITDYENFRLTYTYALPIIRTFAEKYGKDNVAKAYFSNDVKYFEDIFGDKLEKFDFRIGEVFESANEKRISDATDMAKNLSNWLLGLSKYELL